jgi:replication initiation and membrane attachment protein DnaB
LEEAGIGHRETASGYLKKLEGIGLLRGFKKGREVYYINEPMLNILFK